jgi:hypothetical protein
VSRLAYYLSYPPHRRRVVVTALALVAVVVVVALIGTARGGEPIVVAAATAPAAGTGLASDPASPEVPQPGPVLPQQHPAGPPSVLLEPVPAPAPASSPNETLAAPNLSPAPSP